MKLVLSTAMAILILSAIAVSSEFLWGTATAAYQIEGAAAVDGRGPSIWDKFSREEGKVASGDNGDIADDAYNKYKEDVELLSNIGVNSYRFSISWTRLLPTGRLPINTRGLEYYNNLINALVEKNIEPVVTLYHWDLPQTLHDEYGGWLSPGIVADFLSYARICFENFGDRVKIWLTLNEPWTFCYLGYVTGKFAPGRCSDRRRCPQGNSSTEGYLAAHNALNAHAAVVNLYRRNFQETQKGKIGIALNQDWGEPWSSDPADVAAAERKNEFQLSWFGDPIMFGRYPLSMIQRAGGRLPVFTEEQRLSLIGSVDFWAFNHYTTKYIYEPRQPTADLVDGGGWAADLNIVETKYSLQGELIGPQGASPWLNVVPWGFYNTLRWHVERYGVGTRDLPILITENGCDVPNEENMTIAEAQQDYFRISYYESYLKKLEQIRSEGVEVMGYMAWSFLDNFEWADGYSYRFGLYYVDYRDPGRPRYPKLSAAWYRQYIQRETESSLQQNPSLLLRLDSWVDFLRGAYNNPPRLLGRSLGFLEL